MSFENRKFEWWDEHDIIKQEIIRVLREFLSDVSPDVLPDLIAKLELSIQDNSISDKLSKIIDDNSWEVKSKKYQIKSSTTYYNSYNDLFNWKNWSDQY